MSIFILQSFERCSRILDHVSGAELSLIKKIHHILRLHLRISKEMLLQNNQQFLIFHFFFLILSFRIVVQMILAANSDP